jgi:hypothetical protein
MDALLDICRSMQLTGGVFLEAEFTAPWCVTSQIAPEDCGPFMPQPAQLIAYHFDSFCRRMGIHRFLFKPVRSS